MTITLHWWMLPVGILTLGVCWAKLWDDGSPMDVLPALIFVCSLVAAVCIVIGHFL